jgi:hypothetical protein
MDPTQNTFESAEALWRNAPLDVLLPTLRSSFGALEVVRGIASLRICHDETNGDGTTKIEFIYDDFAYEAWFDPCDARCANAKLEYCIPPLFSDAEMIVRCNRINAKGYVSKAYWRPETRSLAIEARFIMNFFPKLDELFALHLRDMRETFEAVLA